MDSSAQSSNSRWAASTRHFGRPAARPCVRRPRPATGIRIFMARTLRSSPSRREGLLGEPPAKVEVDGVAFGAAVRYAVAEQPQRELVVLAEPRRPLLLAVLGLEEVPQVLDATEEELVGVEPEWLAADAQPVRRQVGAGLVDPKCRKIAVRALSRRRVLVPRMERVGVGAAVGQHELSEARSASEPRLGLQELHQRRDVIR